MTGSLAFPLGVALALAVTATSVHRRLPPRLASRMGAVALVLVAVAAVPTVLIVGIAFLAHAPVVGFGFRWCARAFGLHGSVSPWVGLPVAALLVWGAVRTVALVRGYRAVRRRGCGGVHVAESATPYAVTLPGRAGQIVVSTALLDLLDDAEQHVVLAHERAHARYRHDRYLLVAELAAAAMPPLRGLSRRVTYSVERWADEVAAAACGDRRLVAMTLGKVALRQHPATVAGFASLGVAARMGALLDPPVRRPRRPIVVALWATLLLAAAFSAYQLHHLEGLLTALCPH